MIARSTAVPTVLLRLPGEVMTGTTAVLKAAATLTRTIFATEGTPASSNTNTIQVPGGTSEARAGICTDSVEPWALKGSSTKRWFMLKPCVTAPVAMKVTREIGRPLLTVSCTVRPVSTTLGALSMIGRVATVAAAVKR